MDDQNQTNQPLDAATNPVVPSVPEDITPIEPPVTTTTTTTSSFEPTAPVEVPSAPPVETIPAAEPTPVVEVAPPVEAAPGVSWPVPGPTQAPTPQAETTTTTTTSVATPVVEPVSVPAPEEVPMPTGKPKKKILPIIGGVVALLLVVGVAGAAYYVSNQLSTRQAVAPNAPESEPLALAPPTCAPGANNVPCENAQWKGTCYNGVCAIAEIYCTGCGWKPATQTCNQWIATGCDGDQSGSSCTASGVSNGCNYVSNVGSTGSTGSPCDASNWANDSCTAYSYKCGVYCFLASCGASACVSPTAALSCDESKRDAPASNQITFAKSGKVIPFMRNTYTGTLTLSKAGSADINIPFKTGNAVELASFMVTAGDTYTIKNKISTDANNSYGWIPNKSPVLCGPIKTPGNPLNGSTSTGLCGNDADISAVKTLAMSKTDLAGITSGSANASIQCWGDGLIGDASQDYDYNDYTVVFGYEIAAPTATVTTAPTVTVTTAPTVGACMEIKIYKKVNNVYGTVALTPAELGSLKVGDVLKLTSMANVDSLLGRFQITIGSEAPVLMPAEIVSGVPKQHVLTDYTVSKAGTYKFEAQVTTKSTN